MEAAGVDLEGAEAALPAEECAAGSEAGSSVIATMPAGTKGSVIGFRGGLAGPGFRGGLAGPGFRGAGFRRDFVGPRFARFGHRRFAFGFAPVFVGAGLYPWAYGYDYDDGCWVYTPWGPRYVCGGYGGYAGWGGYGYY